MFLCSECHGRKRVLYARNTGQQHGAWLFSCRKCAGITYQSTMGHRWDRSARRVEKLRARLEWGANGTMPRLGIDSGIAGGLPEKRKGMPARTYARLLEKTLEAEILADEAWL